MRWRAIIRWAAPIGAAAAAAIAVNVVLLGVAENRDDPVGRLTPRVLIGDTAEPTSLPGNDAPPTEPAQTITNGDDDDRDDNSPADTQPDDDSSTDEPGEEDDD